MKILIFFLLFLILLPLLLYLFLLLGFLFVLQFLLWQEMNLLNLIKQIQHLPTNRWYTANTILRANIQRFTENLSPHHEIEFPKQPFSITKKKRCNIVKFVSRQKAILAAKYA
uniref:Uncharacterized protein n=1 Tax=Cacopsylla melanoneura TaxID=428564 RepID=A0A8D9BME2_9HEMI